ncbi:hypothetical protein HAX54_019670 [Datura stramonium]|uniref:Late embryogenesis abundant protein LEA-2 subgroup domain-containing protein n=1 Tax=Datura stramonium TaxID=4076 RepID=A0ABS8S2C9_DATST|nr:hypothetical protein [Datura stramonium]
MAKQEEKPALGYPRSEHFYPTDPQYYQTEPQFYQTNAQLHQMPHSAYAQPCGGYPNNASMYQQQSYQYYEYNYPARPLPYVSPDIDRGFSFGRVMLCLMFFLVLFAMIMSMFTYMIFMTMKPTFSLESFVVPMFDLSGDGGPGTTLKANWETKLSVRNMNHRSSVFINHAEMTLVYRYIGLDTSSVDSVEIPKESTVQILDVFSFPNSKNSYNFESVVNEMAKDRVRGQIMFDLKLEVQVMVKSNVFQKAEKMRLFCERITLHFQNGSSNIPTWDGSKRECVPGF